MICPSCAPRIKLPCDPQLLRVCADRVDFLALSRANATELAPFGYQEQALLRMLLQAKAEGSVKELCKHWQRHSPRDLAQFIANAVRLWVEKMSLSEHIEPAWISSLRDSLTSLADGIRKRAAAAGSVAARVAKRRRYLVTRPCD